MKKALTTLSFIDQVLEIEPKEVLSDAKVKSLIRFCSHTSGMGDLTFLSKAQQKQVMAKAIQEAESYRETHSMRYGIMRDVTSCLFNLAKPVVVKLENRQYCVYMTKGSKVAKNPIGTFTEYNAMNTWCRMHSFKFTSVIGE